MRLQFSKLLLALLAFSASLEAANPPVAFHTELANSNVVSLQKLSEQLPGPQKSLVLDIQKCISFGISNMEEGLVPEEDSLNLQRILDGSLKVVERALSFPEASVHEAERDSVLILLSQLKVLACGNFEKERLEHVASQVARSHVLQDAVRSFLSKAGWPQSIMKSIDAVIEFSIWSVARSIQGAGNSFEEELVKVLDSCPDLVELGFRDTVKANFDLPVLSSEQLNSVQGRIPWPAGPVDEQRKSSLRWILTFMLRDSRLLGATKSFFSDIEPYILTLRGLWFVHKEFDTNLVYKLSQLHLSRQVVIAPFESDHGRCLREYRDLLSIWVCRFTSGNPSSELSEMIEDFVCDIISSSTNTKNVEKKLYLMKKVLNYFTGHLGDLHYYFFIVPIKLLKRIHQCPHVRLEQLEIEVDSLIKVWHQSYRNKNGDYSPFTDLSGHYNEELPWKQLHYIQYHILIFCRLKRVLEPFEENPALILPAPNLIHEFYEMVNVPSLSMFDDPQYPDKQINGLLSLCRESIMGRGSCSCCNHHVKKLMQEIEAVKENTPVTLLSDTAKLERLVKLETLSSDLELAIRNFKCLQPTSHFFSVGQEESSPVIKAVQSALIGNSEVINDESLRNIESNIRKMTEVFASRRVIGHQNPFAMKESAAVRDIFLGAWLVDGSHN